MARASVFLHIGPGLAGVHDLQPLLHERRDLLNIGGLSTPTLPPGLMRRAGLEIRGEHRAAGLRRAEVEGAWAEVCRSVFRTRDAVALSQERFAHATPGQIALLLDGLAGRDVHVVAIAPASQADLEDILTPWSAYIKRDHLHAIRLAHHPSPRDLLDELVGLALRTSGRDLNRRIARQLARVGA